MKKELILCIVIILIVVLGNIITQNYTKECALKLDKELTRLKEKIIQNNSNKKEINDDIKEIKKLWKDMQEILAFYIEHDELEKVETQLCLLEGEIQMKLYNDAIPEIDKCAFILKHIAEKTALKLKNVF